MSPGLKAAKKSRLAFNAALEAVLHPVIADPNACIDAFLAGLSRLAEQWERDLEEVMDAAVLRMVVLRVLSNKYHPGEIARAQRRVHKVLGLKAPVSLV